MNYGRRRAGKQASKIDTAKLERAALRGLMATGINTIFSTAGLFLGGHWELDDEESDQLAKGLDDAIKTLPESSYEIIKQYVEKIIPWVGLGIGLVAATKPRIEHTVELRAMARARAKAANPGWRSDVGGGEQTGAGYGPPNPWPGVADPYAGTG